MKFLADICKVTNGHELYVKLVCTNVMVIEKYGQGAHAKIIRELKTWYPHKNQIIMCFTGEDPNEIPS